MTDFQVVDNEDLASNGAGNSGRHWRIKISSASLLDDAETIKVLFEYVANWSLSSAWVGHKGVGDFDFDGNQQQLFFAGQPGKTLTAETYTDECVFPLDNTRDLIISLACTSSGIPYGTSTGKTARYNTGGDAAAAASVMSSPNDPGGYIVSLKGIIGVGAVSFTTVMATLDQPYKMVDFFRVTIDQPYGLLSHLLQIIDQPYGLRMLTILTQWYGDTPAVKAILEQYYGSADLLRRLCQQHYGDTLQLRQSLNQEWNLPGNLLAIMEQRYSISGEELRQLMEQNYNLSEYNLLWQTLDQIFVLSPDSLAAQSITIPTTADGILVDPHHINIEIDEDEYAIKGEFHFADQKDFLLCKHIETEIVTTIGGTEYHLIVEGPRQSRPEWGKTEYYVPCASKTILLDAPYAVPIDKQFTGALAEAIVAEMAATEGITIDWQLIDWYIPSGILIANKETPMTVIRKVVEAVGGKIQTSPAGVLICRPEYPVSTTNWDIAPPDFYLTDMANYFSIDSTPDIRDGYNRFMISDKTIAQDGLTLEQISIDAMTKDIYVYQVPWKTPSEVVLNTSGGGWVTIVNEGIATEQITEMVEIIAGEGNVQKPFYGLISSNYKETELGTITIEEDKKVSTAIAQNSLIEIVYTTKYYKFRVRDYAIEEVQFFPEDLLI